MSSGDLEPGVVLLEHKLTSAFVEGVVRELLAQRPGGSRGVGALDLVMYLACDITQRPADVVWIYRRLKAALRTAVEQSPSLQYVEGG